MTAVELRNLVQVVDDDNQPQGFCFTLYPEVPLVEPEPTDQDIAEEIRDIGRQIEEGEL